MKKLTALLLILCTVLSCSACGSTASSPSAASTVPSAPQTEPTTPSTESADNLIQIGNLTFELGDQMSYEERDNKASIVTVVPDKSYIVTAVLDISNLASDQIADAVSTQHAAFTAERGKGCKKKPLELEICGFTATGESYGDVTASGSLAGYMDLTFTDTYYAYTFQYFCSPDDNDDAYNLGITYGQFLASGKYHGPEPREIEMLETYPLNVSPEYARLAESIIPDQIYTTSGSENGLPGTIYTFHGTVVDTLQINEDDFTLDEAIVETTGGQFLIMNLYKSSYDDTVDEFGLSVAKEAYPDSADGYIFPEIGEKARFIVTYMGYSGAKDMPAFVLGANSAISELYETDDTESSTPVTTAANDGKSSPTTGERNALQQANRYLRTFAFSYDGLIDQLKYEGYTDAEAVYAVDHCGADWDDQALEKAQQYLRSSAFSYSGLVDQLVFEGFTDAQATYGVDGCGADWDDQAVKKAEQYLKYDSFSRDKLISQLQYEGFTYEQAVHGADEAMQ